MEQSEVLLFNQCKFSLISKRGINYNNIGSNFWSHSQNLERCLFQGQICKVGDICEILLPNLVSKLLSFNSGKSKDIIKLSICVKFQGTLVEQKQNKNVKIFRRDRVRQIHNYTYWG